MTTDQDATDWKAIATALAQRVNFAMTNLDARGSGAMLDFKTGKVTPWRDYMAEAMEMIPGVKIDREILSTLYLSPAKRRKAQKDIMAARKAAATQDTPT